MQDLLAHLLNEEDEDKHDEMLRETYGIDHDNFGKLISALMPLMEVGSSPLTLQNYIGFADKAEKTWLLKVKVELN